MDNILTKQIASRLKEARIASGFKSSKDFSNSNDIPTSTYSQHETGKRSISAELIINYSRILDINPYWLLTGKGIIKTNNLTSGGELDTSTDLTNYEEKLNKNTELLKIILISAEQLFYDKSLKISFQELIEYCFDIYKTVFPLSINLDEKKKIIELSFLSMKIGSSIEIKKQVE